jgi:hypothetical protein
MWISKEDTIVDVYYQEELIDSHVSVKYALNNIENYVAQKMPKFKVYYTRMWCQDDNNATIDFGSWSRFIYLRRK